MGFFSAIGSALSNPDIQDRLAAIGASTQGDTQAAQTYQQRVAQRHAAEATAAQIEAERARAAQPAPAAPATVYNSNALPPDGPTQLAPRPAPVTVAPLPQLPPAAAAPAPAPNLPVSAPVASPDAVPAAPRSLYAAMLPQLIRAAGRGADVSGLGSILRDEDYISGLPQKDQAMARAAGAGTYAGWQHGDSKPTEVGYGNRLVVRKPDGSYGEVYTAPDKPDPVTTERVVGAIIAKKARGEELTPQEQDVYNRWKAGSDGFYGERAPHHDSLLEKIVGKMDRGEPLAPGEQAYWDAYKAKGAGGLAAALAGGGDDETAPAPQQNPKPPGASNLPQKPKKAPRQSPQQSGPPPAAAIASIPEGGQATFANGQIWAKRGGKPVFVGMAQ